VQFEQMRLLLNDDRFEAALEHVTCAAMPPVEVLGVPSVEGMHPSRERRTGRFHKEVVVISHQAIGVEEPCLVGDDGGEDVQEMAPIQRVAKDRSAFMAAAGDVVQRPGKLQAEGSRHMHSLLWIVMWQVET
jgi:hypothetical protein